MISLGLLAAAVVLDAVVADVNGEAVTRTDGTVAACLASATNDGIDATIETYFQGTSPGAHCTPVESYVQQAWDQLIAQNGEQRIVEGLAACGTDVTELRRHVQLQVCKQLRSTQDPKSPADREDEIERLPLPPPIDPKTYAGHTIESVSFSGIAPSAAMRAKALAMAKRPYDPIAIRSLLRTWWREDEVRTLAVRATVRPGRALRLVFDAAPRYRITELVFDDGNGETIEVTEHGIRTSRTFDIQTHRNRGMALRDALDRQYRRSNVTAMFRDARWDWSNRGWREVKIVLAIEPRSATTARLAIRIDPGRRYRVGKLTFTGNKQLIEAQLRAAVAGPDGTVNVPGGFYEPTMASVGLDRAHKESEQKGFSWKWEFSSKIDPVNATVDLAWTIVELGMLRVGEIEIEGARSKEEHAALLAVLRVKPKDVLDRRRIQLDLYRLLTTLTDRGARFASVGMHQRGSAGGGIEADLQRDLIWEIRYEGGQ